MSIQDTEALLKLLDEIAFKRTVTFTRSGTLGLPDIREGDMTASYKPLILPSIFGRPARGTHAYPARIVPGVPDTAKEHAALALSSAIVRSEDRNTTMMRIVEAFGNRALTGGKLDSTALAEILAEVMDQLIYREGLGQVHGDPDGLHLITHQFRTMVASAYKELVLDEWEAIFDGPIVLDRLRNVSSFYGYLHATGMVRSWEFLETLDIVLDHYTDGSLDLLMVAVIYLMSHATLNAHTPRIIPVKYWNIVLGQLNDIEARSQTSREIVGDEMEEDMVEMLCGKGPASAARHPPHAERTRVDPKVALLAQAHSEALEEWVQFTSESSQIITACDGTAVMEGNQGRASDESLPDSAITVVTATSSDDPSKLVVDSDMELDTERLIDPEDYSEVHTAAIDALRQFVNEFLDADTAAGIFRAPFYRTGFVEYCIDPPNLRSNKARYLLRLCERIKRWANVKGVETEMNWGIILEEYDDDFWGFEKDDEIERQAEESSAGAVDYPASDTDHTALDVDHHTEEGANVETPRRAAKDEPKTDDLGNSQVVTRPLVPKGDFPPPGHTPEAPETGSIIRQRRGLDLIRGPLLVDTTLKHRKPRGPPNIGSIIPFIDPRVAGEKFDQKVLKTHDVIWRLNPEDNFFHPHAVKRAEMGNLMAKTGEEWASLCVGDSVDPFTSLS